MEGSTALGPALTVCAGLVANEPTSDIILCTDGMPNTGIGSLDNSGACSAGISFYQQVKVNDRLIRHKQMSVWYESWNAPVLVNSLNLYFTCVNNHEWKTNLSVRERWFIPWKVFYTG